MSSNFAPAFTSRNDDDLSRPRPQAMGLAGLGVAVLGLLALAAAGFLLLLWALLATPQITF